MCKKIHRGGNAEQYHADKKYKEAVAVAVEKCADDTKGQTCFICTQALHLKTKEGLVRGCACRGTAGFAHVSCLVEQAKILMDEAEYNNLGDKAFGSRWARWYTCSLCEQEYHGVVYCALGWACWKTYLGRPETAGVRMSAMRQLGLGLCAAGHYEDALSVNEADLATLRRIGAPEVNILDVQGNLSINYEKLGRLEDALRLKRDVYSGSMKLSGEEDSDTLLAANNYAATLIGLKHFEEAKALLRKTVPLARRVHGEGHETTLRMRSVYAAALFDDPGATLDNRSEAVAMLEDTVQIARRVLGGTHPLTMQIENIQQRSREALSAREVGSTPSATPSGRFKRH